MDIRRARPGEAALLGDIALHAKSHWPYCAEQIAAWRSDLAVTPEQISSCPTCVAQIDAIVAGFYMLEPRQADWTLEHLWVLPDYMGRGIGRALLSHARGVATAAGAEALTIDADPYAEPFYLACGAIRVGTVAAPINGAPDRVRPQMRLPIVVR